MNFAIRCTGCDGSEGERTQKRAHLRAQQKGLPTPKILDSVHPRLDMRTAHRFWGISKTLPFRVWRACVAGKMGQFL